MVDKWNNWYKDLSTKDIGSFKYGDTVTYKLGYTYLQSCNTIEDWGCGTGGFKRFFINNETFPKYIGVDGSKTPFADIKADLTKYVSTVDGIFMRHILEHNYDWKAILENACRSFTQKMCLVLFTPFTSETKELAHNLCHGVDVPDLSFDKNEILKIFEKYNITYDLSTFNTDTGYNIEHVFYLTKAPRLNLAFYTYFYGSNSNPAFKIPSLPSLKYKCYYYTNNKTIIENLQPTGWIGVYEDTPTNDDLIESCMRGKHIKAMPHNYAELKDYDYLCFIDSKAAKVNTAFVEQCIDTYFIKQNYALLLRQHEFLPPDVWVEFNVSMRQERYRLEREKYEAYIHKQVAKGLNTTTPQHCQCGFLIRNMKHPKMIDIDTTWYQHIQECGIQDQISFFFVKQFFEGYIRPFTEYPYV